MDDDLRSSDADFKQSMGSARGFILLDRACLWQGPGACGAKMDCEARLFTSSLTIAFVSILLVLLSHTLVAIVLSVVLAGLTLGPIFPLCMTTALTLTNDSLNTKWIFATPGLGGAALAWMTGRVSAYEGSLRAGLMVPAFALGAMIVLLAVQGFWRRSC